MTAVQIFMKTYPPRGLFVWGIIRKFEALKKYKVKNHTIIMKKKLLYTAPAVRELDVRFDASFLQSTTAGPIDPWTDDDDPINFN